MCNHRYRLKFLKIYVTKSRVMGCWPTFAYMLRASKCRMLRVVLNGVEQLSQLSSALDHQAVKCRGCLVNFMCCPINKSSSTSSPKHQMAIYNLFFLNFYAISILLIITFFSGNKLDRTHILLKFNHQCQSFQSEQHLFSKKASPDEILCILFLTHYSDTQRCKAIQNQYN